jgi:hypothetical protein
MSTRFLTAGLLLLLLVAAAACTASDDGEGVASVGGTAAPAASASGSRLDQLIQYTRCMREHGVPMTDPEVDGDYVRLGQIDKAAAGDKLNPADDACKQYRPAQEAGPATDLKNELARNFAKCMRAYGVEDYPDPGPDGTRVPPAVNADPDFMDARPICDAQEAAEWASRAPSVGVTR